MPQIEYAIWRKIRSTAHGWEKLDSFMGQLALERAICAFTIYQK